MKLLLTELSVPFYVNLRNSLRSFLKTKRKQASREYNKNILIKSIYLIRPQQLSAGIHSAVYASLKINIQESEGHWLVSHRHYRSTLMPIDIKYKKIFQKSRKNHCKVGKVRRLPCMIGRWVRRSIWFCSTESKQFHVPIFLKNDIGV